MILPSRIQTCDLGVCVYLNLKHGDLDYLAATTAGLSSVPDFDLQYLQKKGKFKMTSHKKCKTVTVRIVSQLSGFLWVPTGVVQDFWEYMSSPCHFYSIPPS